ncbi:hypothetical protein G6M04_16400 [Agrobacterium rhizogenes]|uniref:hypothetical protein n=1 Tax=Rhizobium rhizogenes TaxID=359 RepID=UPI0015723365|nr:hypothetical protein [Rhizobium rhizogenes]NTG48959.1 hypothetical protein [Rhizobium rhizogenes]
MSNELPQGQQRAIPLEVLNAELAAKLDFTERRLLSMAAVAFDLQVKVNQLTETVARLSQAPAPAAQYPDHPSAGGNMLFSEEAE